MRLPGRIPHVAAALASLLVTTPLPAHGPDDAFEASDGAERLVAALMAETPLVDDLRELTDTIGGRPTGSEANERAVTWAADTLRKAGVDVRLQPFEMPRHWRETHASARIVGDEVAFEARVAAKPFSAATPAEGLRAPLVDVGYGTEDDFTRVGEAARDAFVLVATHLLEDVPGLFAEYMDGYAVEEAARGVGAVGVIYAGARPGDHLYRMNASRGLDNEMPLVVMDRTNAERARRLLTEGIALEATLALGLDPGSEPYTATNVIGEIRGTSKPEEIVVVGAHLDSWGLGTGALDNGSNVCMLIDVARQIRRLGLRPRRTIRFALWNGEEQGLFGSWGYVRAERDSLDRHVAAFSFDIGTGRIDGFFTNGRLDDVGAVLDGALAPVAGLGPFAHHDAPLYGTDHFDFLIEGVVGLVASQQSANYGPHYHASSDTFDKVDQQQLRHNAAIAAAVTWGFAQADVTWARWTVDEIRAIVAGPLGEQMKAFGAWNDWESGRRGRHD